jgi:DNA modification methylase
VLDPFLGSGTTAAVASELQRRYIGIELNPAYVKLARGRLRESVRSPTFVAAE